MISATNSTDREKISQEGPGSQTLPNNLQEQLQNAGKQGTGATFYGTDGGNTNAVPSGTRGGTGLSLSPETKKNAPKLYMTLYKTEPEQPIVGKDFTLTLHLHNSNREKSVRNIKGTLSFENGFGLEGQDLGPAFLPQGSSNSFYTERIDPDKDAVLTIQLRGQNGMAAKVYQATLDLEYEDKEGNAYRATERFGISFKQKAELLIDPPELISAGTEKQEMTLQMNLYNTGKDTLSNFLVDCEGGDFEVKGSPRYYVGEFKPGASDHYRITLLPKKTGKVQGKLRLSYEDSAGENHQQELSFAGETDAANQESILAADQPQTDQKDTGMGVWPLFFLGLLLLAGIGYGVIRWRRKKKQKKEEEELNLHA